MVQVHDYIRWQDATFPGLYWPQVLKSGAKEGLGMRLHGRMLVSVPEQQVWEWNHKLFLICCF